MSDAVECGGLVERPPIGGPMTPPPNEDPSDVDLQRLRSVAFDLETAIEGTRSELLRYTDQLLMARRRMSRYLRTRALVDGR